MAEVITIPYRPRHPGVHEELEAHRFAVLVAHRRFGKTVLAVNHLLKQAICVSAVPSPMSRPSAIRRKAWRGTTSGITPRPCRAAW